MKELVKSPLKINHYDFMKKFLNDAMEPHLTKLEDKKAPETERSQALEALNKELQNELAALNTTLAAEKEAILKKQLAENIEKLNHVIDTLSNPEKKKTYDAALENPKPVSIAIKEGSKKGLSLVALVPLPEIESVFEKFVADQKKAWPSSKGPFPEGNYTSELRKGPPEVLILTFPDAESANAFISQLFKNNQAMFPDGSQDINDLDKQQAAQEQEETTIDPTQRFRSQVENVRQQAEEPTESSAPKPSPFGSGKK